MSAQLESCRVSTPEGVFETDLETLKQWIVEGCVLPNDKVSKGNLNWLEAGRVPMLRAAFFYYPMALAVAGYTQSFGSVVNPLVGLDTIRRMGSTCFKAFGMVLGNPSGRNCPDSHRRRHHRSVCATVFRQPPGDVH